MKVGAMGAVAAVVGVLVVGDVIASAMGMWHGAGWYALIALAFPAFMLIAVKRGWGGPRPY